MEYIDLVKLKEHLGADEFRVISSIGPRLLQIDEIIEESGLGAGAVLSALTMLELDGYVEQSKGKYFKVIYEMKK
jgi:DNA processing protein